MSARSGESRVAATGAGTTRRDFLGRAAGGLMLAAGGLLAPAVGREPGGGSRSASAHDERATPGAHESGAASTPGAGQLDVRRNGKDLSASERETLVNAILALKQKPSPWAPGLSVYDTFVLWHRDAFGCAVMAAHMGPAFLPWHRQFLRMFEQELQAIEPAVTLPYWDWAVDQGVDAYLWADDFMGGNGDPDEGFAVTTGPFRKGEWELAVFDYGDPYQYTFLIRDFGAVPFAPTLPTPEQVASALDIPTYDAAPWNTTVPPSRSFRNAIEGWQDCVKETCDPVDGLAPTCTGPHNLHNQVHLWVAGEFALAVEGARQGERGDTVVIANPASPAISIFGTMAANSSLNDPIFWLHHANLDRLWSEWMRRHGAVYEPVTGGPLGHNIDDAMWPYHHLGMTITPRTMLSSQDLGYVYDTEL